VGAPAARRVVHVTCGRQLQCLQRAVDPNLEADRERLGPHGTELFGQRTGSDEIVSSAHPTGKGCGPDVRRTVSRRARAVDCMPPQQFSRIAYGKPSGSLVPAHPGNPADHWVSGAPNPSRLCLCEEHLI
jgi:hypothetical protein